MLLVLASQPARKGVAAVLNGSPVPTATHGPGHYPAWLRSLLGDGPTGDPLHAATVRAVLGLLNCGQTPDDAYRIVWNSPGLGPLVQRPSSGAGWLHRKVAVALAQFQASPANGSAAADGARADVAEARALKGTLRLDWPDLSDTSGQVVLGAFLNLCDRLGRTHGVGVSWLDLARGTSLGDRTVARAKRALLDRGVLVLEAPARRRPGKGARAPEYRLDLARLRTLATPSWTYAPKGTPGVEAAAARLQCHDAWTRGALGPSRAALWEALDPDEAQTPVELAKRLPWKRRHVAALLELLAAYRLALRSGDGWVRCGVTDARARLDEAAAHYGVLGLGDERHVKRLAERERWLQGRAEYLSRLATERSAVVGEYVDPGTGERWVLDPDTGELVAPTPDTDDVWVLPNGERLRRVDAPALWVHDDDGPVRVSVAWLSVGATVTWDDVPRNLTWDDVAKGVGP